MSLPFRLAATRRRTVAVRHSAAESSGGIGNVGDALVGAAMEQLFAPRRRGGDDPVIGAQVIEWQWIATAVLGHDDRALRIEVLAAGASSQAIMLRCRRCAGSPQFPARNRTARRRFAGTSALCCRLRPSPFAIDTAVPVCWPAHLHVLAETDHAAAAVGPRIEDAEHSTMTTVAMAKPMFKPRRPARLLALSHPPSDPPRPQQLGERHQRQHVIAASAAAGGEEHQQQAQPPDQPASIGLDDAPVTQRHPQSQ